LVVQPPFQQAFFKQGMTGRGRPFSGANYEFVAFERAKQGTGASRRLRNSGKTPGIVYGGSAEPQLIEVDHNALWHALKKEAFHSSVLDMELAGTDRQGSAARRAIPPLQATGAAHRLPARGRKDQAAHEGATALQRR
jgi:ribosomal protein L25 (general stress protein Ctc)